jgi:hypothetical protein
MKMNLSVACIGLISIPVLQAQRQRARLLNSQNRGADFGLVAEVSELSIRSVVLHPMVKK